MYLRIFISYGRDEHANLARQLRDDLLGRGHEVWFDEDRLEAGTDWEARIQSGLDWLAEKRESARFLLLLTPHSVRRPDGFCLNELAYAIGKRIGVIPVMVVWCEPPLSIARIQYLDMQDCIPVETHKECYQKRLDRLVCALEQGDLCFEGTQQVLLSALQPIDFDTDIAPHMSRFEGREWLLEEIDDWLGDPDGSKAFALVGPPGIGKTALTCWLIRRRSEVAAFHLCSHSSQQKGDPVRAVKSIAYQLSTQLPEYERLLMELDLDYITREYADARTLFDVLVSQPLNRCQHPGRIMVVAIDALDEASHSGRNALAELVSSESPKAPSWLRILCTSRMEPEVMGPLHALKPRVIDAAKPENNRDIAVYAARRLEAAGVDDDDLEDAVRLVVEKSEGIILYAVAACEQVSSDAGDVLAQLGDLPPGVDGFYSQHLARRYPDPALFRESARKPLGVLLASYEPMDIHGLSFALQTPEDEVRDLLDELGSFVLAEETGVRLFHRSLADWLACRSRAVAYYVSTTEGHSRLADATMRAAERGPGRRTDYLFRFGPSHLAEDERWPELLELAGDADFHDAMMDLLGTWLNDPEGSLAEELECVLRTAIRNSDSRLVLQLLEALENAVLLGRAVLVEEVLERARPLMNEPGPTTHANFLGAWCLEQRGRLADSLARFDEVDADLLVDKADLIEFHHSNALRESGHFDAAEAIYSRLSADAQRQPGKWPLIYLQQYADLLYVRGRFRTALEILEGISAPEHETWPEAVAESLRIQGHVMRMLLDEQAALDYYLASRHLFERIGSASGLARIETNLAETYATMDPRRGLALADSAVELNDAIEAPIESGKAHRAAGLSLALISDFERAAERFAVSDAMLTDVGYRAGVCWTQADRIVAHLRQGDSAKAREVLHDMAGRLQGLGAYPLLTYRSLVLLDQAGVSDEALGDLRLQRRDDIEWPLEPSDFDRRAVERLQR